MKNFCFFFPVKPKYHVKSHKSSNFKKYFLFLLFLLKKTVFQNIIKPSKARLAFFKHARAVFGPGAGLSNKMEGISIMELEHTTVNLRVGVGKFFYGHGCIRELAAETARLGGKPLVIGGPTAVKLILGLCEAEFRAAGVTPLVRVHTGACSRTWAGRYKEEALQNGCTLILGVGGGKCLDLAKCAATFAGLDLICVPTSVATCVASSSVCIMYHDDGTPDGSVAMSKEVDVVIADTDVIATAPKRLLAAGIFDSLAKLPEVVHNTQIESYQDCTLEKYICTVNSRAIYEFLMGEGPRVYDQGLASGRFTDVILTNLLHTSVVSGFSCGVNQLALAHGLYDFLRRSFTAQAAHLLHGEIVAVGILMQLKFNRMADAYVLGVRRLMAHMQLPTRLPDLGFEPTPENLQLLVDYLLPATGLSPADEPRLRAAIAEIC